MMVEIVEDKSLLETKEALKDYKFAYKIFKSGELIGIGAINNNTKNNMIFIALIDEYRGVGLGKDAFIELVGKSREKGNKLLRIIVEKQNIPMIRIVKRLHGTEVSEDNNEITFII